MLLRNNLLNYKDKYIYQDTNYFKMSIDSVLLANFVTVNLRDKNIIDLATGNAPIPMLLTYRTNAHIYGVEIQEGVYNLGKISINENKMKNQISLINDDVNNLKSYFSPDSFDTIICNPPYFATSNVAFMNKNLNKSIARHEINLKLEDVFTISRYLLKNNGKLAIIHRTNRLIEILKEASKFNLTPKKIRFVYPNKTKNSNLVLIEFVLNGKNGLKLMPPLYIYEKDRKYSKEILEMFGK